MTKLKRIVSIILSVLLVAAICVPAFAADGETTTTYNYTEDENLKLTSDYESGEFAWGGYSPAFFHVLSKKVYPLSEIPKQVDEETGEPTDKDLYEDSTACDAENEIIFIAAYYAFECPKCGRAYGGYTIASIYSQTKGMCSGSSYDYEEAEGVEPTTEQVGCGAMFPNPKELDIYRYIVINESTMNPTSHSKSMRNYDLTKAAKSVYGDTASLYGDGKDLPESSIAFKTDGDIMTRSNGLFDIESISKTSVKPDSKDAFMAKLLVFITKLQYKLTPILSNYANSSWAEFKNNLRVRMAGIWEAILVSIVS